LTKWEGTRWAKERFEREQGIVIRDTTSVSFPPFISPGFESPGSLSGAATTSIIFVFEKPKQPLEPPGSIVLIRWAGWYRTLGSP
jgi:hypothetical protein